MRRFTRLAAAVAAVFTLAALTPVSPFVGDAEAQEKKMGVVVTQLLITKSKAGQAAFEKLNARKKVAQEKLDKRAEELKEMEADFRKRAMVLSGDEKKKAAEEFEERGREAKRLKEDLERDLQREEQEAMQEVNAFLVKVMIDFGKEENYDLIVDAQAAVFFSPRMDITEEVLKRADKAWK